jgi:type I restriction enzyme S subunit
VVVAKVTPCFENRKSAVAKNLTNEVAFGTTEITVLRPNERITAEYLRYVVSSERFIAQGTGSMTGSGGLKRVPDNFIRNYKIALPSISQQLSRVTFLAGKLTKIDELTNASTSIVELLKVRRQALISAAVTGKIDVRGK